MRENKINPMSGCLPMLIQLPVFFGLFAMLRTAVELRGDDAMPIAGGIGPGKATGQDVMLRAVATVVQGQIGRAHV